MPARPPSPRSSCCTAAPSTGPARSRAGRAWPTPSPTGWPSSRNAASRSPPRAMQFEYHDHLINLLDTPGHQDFSEDTYRALTAADSVVMLLDCAKGVEEQTKKLFRVAKERDLPIFTFVNKLDRPGREPVELIDEVEELFGLHAVPMTWPIGSGTDFKGVYVRASGQIQVFERTRGRQEGPGGGAGEPGRPGDRGPAHPPGDAPAQGRHRAHGRGPARLRPGRVPGRGASRPCSLAAPSTISGWPSSWRSSWPWPRRPRPGPWPTAARSPWTRRSPPSSSRSRPT